MPTHLDPAFVEPTPPQPVEKDPDTLDIFAQPADETEAEETTDGES